MGDNPIYNNRAGPDPPGSHMEGGPMDDDYEEGMPAPKYSTVPQRGS